MDRSFLSDAAVVAASRDMVCVRLLTYESAEEAAFLKGLFTGREGTLENTVFTILAPDGKSRLLRPSRTPKMTFGGSEAADLEEMAEAMKDAVKRYPGKKDAGERALPVAADLHEALNLAACDNQPLVIVHGGDAALEKKVAKLAWSEAFLGKFVYVKLAADASLKGVKDIRPAAGVAVVQPGKFGLDGAAIAQADASATPETLENALKDGLAKFKPEDKDERAHVEEGRRKGIDWKTVVPDTDPGPPGAHPPK